MRKKGFWYYAKFVSLFARIICENSVCCKSSPQRFYPVRCCPFFRWQRHHDCRCAQWALPCQISFSSILVLSYDFLFWDSFSKQWFLHKFLLTSPSVLFFFFFCPCSYKGILPFFMFHLIRLGQLWCLETPRAHLNL